jgi:hypothetical protein
MRSIADAHARAVPSGATANSVGPEPLIEQPNAPASSAARFTSSNFG